MSPSASWNPQPLLLPTKLRGKRKSEQDETHTKTDIPGVSDWSPWEDGKPLSSREFTSLQTLCEMARAYDQDSPTFYHWAMAYINHLVLLRRLPLSQRSFDVVQVTEETAMNDFLAKFLHICTKGLPNVPNDLRWDSFDLLDGRLLRYVDGAQVILPEPLATEAHQFLEKIIQITGFQVPSSLSSPAIARIPRNYGDNSVITPTDGFTEHGVLEFSHPILDSYLHDIYVVPTTVTEPESEPRIFQELSHWHNARTSINVKRIPHPKTKWELKRQQKWMAACIQYSASLTNASGKIINPESITVKDQTTQKLSDSTKKSKPANQAVSKRGQTSNKMRGKNSKGGKESAREAHQELSREKNDVKATRAMTMWAEQCKLFDKEPHLIRRHQKVIKYMKGLTTEARSAVGAEVLLYSCNILAFMLALRNQPYGPHETISALLWSTVQDISKMEMSPTSVMMFNTFAKALEFPRKYPPVEKTPVRLSLPYWHLPNQEAATKSLPPVGIDFQLCHCGPFLERSSDPAPDDRVPFNPDAWQRKVLDAIDADKSLFVVAPTSAGKTFISFYAMKKVMETSDDGVLVYVAPTKALVNQISAEIQARFSKSYKHSGKSVWAIHTRDYRVNNPTGCQVLVTVPHILQIMLLAPSSAENENSWARRVKRIIFDEVHCIGQADDGVIWEQLLLLAPCPIIALSATVGNPLEFKEWLEGSEKVKGNELEMIVHSTRYSDLRKFIWQPPRDNPVFSGLQPTERLPVPGLDESSTSPSRFSYIHPVASLINRNRGSIQDLSLEARDCLKLWASMTTHQNAAFPLDPSLDPRVALGNPVRKADVAEFETRLKAALEIWMNNLSSPFGAVQKDLQLPCVAPKLSDQGLREKALSLLVDLHSQGVLPAILFSYDRVNCEETVFKLLNDLSEAEKAWKLSSPEWQKTMNRFTQWKKADLRIRAQNEKANKSKTKSKSRRDEDEAGDDRMQDDPSPWASFNPDAPLPEFSFADHTKFTVSELKETVSRLYLKDMDPRFIAALHRGIGVHHAGMNRSYRQIVEMLFRKGFLTVVICTGTLALGLNMPCKTVVFFGDSVYLTALNYHQAAGRAGRRGFDLLGNVVFAGMKQERVYEIMSSRLPDLRGHFPLSTTLVLRTLGLLHHTKNSDYSVRAVQSLLSQTRLYLGGPADRMSIKHHLRFSIEYLRRQNLISKNGTPLNFAGLVGHLYYTENAVFAFHSLLKEGYFHKLMVEFQSEPDGTLLKIVLILSHIFCRLSTRNFREHWKGAVRRSPSVVFLPPLPVEALQILRKHNRDTLGIYQNYANTFAKQHLGDKPDRVLPFTGFEVGVDQDHDYGTVIFQKFGVGHLPAPKLRSPFSSLSGFTDDSFASIHELCSTIRTGIFLEESAIPFIPLHPDDTDGVMWNSYLYDFYKHGDITALIRDNHIKRGDVWFHLKDFSLVLATIVTSLRIFLDLGSGEDGDLAMMDVQDANDSFKEKLEMEDVDTQSDDHAAQGMEDEPTQAPIILGGSQKKAKKDKIPDSWDDEEVDDEPLLAEEDGSGREKRGGTVTEASVSADSASCTDSGENSLPQVLRMFELVRERFDEKFRKIWS